MSTPHNPLELLDRYLQAVRFWLPRTDRQEDLLAELGEDLRSQIEEKETELGHPLSRDEMAAILKRCGSPMVVASRFGPKRYLIGPALYPIYTFVLKMVLFWILVPVFVFILGPVNLANSPGKWGLAMANTIGQLWSGLFIAAGIITLVFAILERTHTIAAMECKWDPLRLPPVRKQERKPSFGRTVSELIFAVFGLIWLLLLPYYPFLILGPAAIILKAAPIWHTFYVPILLLNVLTILRPSMILARPQWSWFPPAGELVQSVLTLILLNFIFNAAGPTPGGNWQPFVVLTDAAAGSAQYVKVAAIVNVSILVCLACSWMGLCIAIVIHLWQLLRYVRNRVLGGGQPASLLVH